MRADSHVPTGPSARRRVVLLDVDGTLVTYTGAMPDSAADAVRRARAAGHRVYPATGRSRAEMPGWFDELGFDGMIGANGSYIESDGEVVAHRRLELMDVATVVDWLTRRDLPFYLEANSGLYASPGFREAALPAVRAYAAGKGRADAETVSVDEALHGLMETADLIRDDVNKISYVLSDAADLEAARTAFPALTHGSWGGRGHAALFGDMGVRGITKSRAIDLLLAHIGAELVDTVALGDATVDIDMLSHCGVGVAMGNASQEVKDAADLVTGDVEADGLVKAFARLSLLD
jgi:cof-like hydrolase